MVALVLAVTGVVSTALRWSIGGGHVDVRTAFVGSGVAMSLLLAEGIRKGKLNGHLRESEPTHYYSYLVIYSVVVIVSVIGALSA